MYLALYIFVLCLVHIQWKYCTQVGICFLKLLETAIIVFAIQAYRQYDTFEIPFNTTMFADTVSFAELFSSATSKFSEL